MSEGTTTAAGVSRLIFGAREVWEERGTDEV